MDVLKVRQISAATLMLERYVAHFFKIPSHINDFQFHFPVLCAAHRAALWTVAALGFILCFSSFSSSSTLLWHLPPFPRSALDLPVDTLFLPLGNHVSHRPYSCLMGSRTFTVMNV